jgi:hypothetical protein
MEPQLRWRGPKNRLLVLFYFLGPLESCSSRGPFLVKKEECYQRKSNGERLPRRLSSEKKATLQLI